MNYKCPYCEKEFGVGELQHPGGIGGGSYCPYCGRKVRIKFPYGRAVALISLIFAATTLILLRVTSIIGFAFGLILLWIPLSLFLNARSVRYKPPLLVKPKPRRRTFFEWLYDRNAPRDIFSKRH